MDDVRGPGSDAGAFSDLIRASARARARTHVSISRSRTILLPLGVLVLVLAFWQIYVEKRGGVLMPRPLGFVKAVPPVFSSSSAWSRV